MHKTLLYLVVAAIGALGLVSCDSSSDGENHVYVYDEASVLSQEMIDSLTQIDASLTPLVVVTTDSLDMADLSGALNNVFDKHKDQINNMESHGAVVVADKTTNTCYIKYGSSYDGIQQAPVEYASSDYYLTQLDGTIIENDTNSNIVIKVTWESEGKEFTNYYHTYLGDRVSLPEDAKVLSITTYRAK